MIIEYKTIMRQVYETRDNDQEDISAEALEILSKNKLHRIQDLMDELETIIDLSILEFNNTGNLAHGEHIISSLNGLGLLDEKRKPLTNVLPTVDRELSPKEKLANAAKSLTEEYTNKFK